MPPSWPPSPKSPSPVGTRHKRKQPHNDTQPSRPPRKGSRSYSNTTTAEDLATRLKEVETLPDLIKEKFTTWTNSAHSFQIECMKAQVLQKDLLLHAATGSGKTGIAAGPHLLLSSKGKVTLFVSPLLALHDQQVGGSLEQEFPSSALTMIVIGDNFPGRIWIESHSCQ
jgi:superfamily II DNA or RNA helicase